MYNEAALTCAAKKAQISSSSLRSFLKTRKTTWIVENTKITSINLGLLSDNAYR